MAAAAKCLNCHPLELSSNSSSSAEEVPEKAQAPTEAPDHSAAAQSPETATAQAQALRPRHNLLQYPLEIIFDLINSPLTVGHAIAIVGAAVWLQSSHLTHVYMNLLKKLGLRMDFVEAICETRGGVAAMIARSFCRGWFGEL